MDIIRNKDKRKGLIGTILFHLALLVIFMLYGLTYEFPPPEQGIKVNFGTSDDGTGEIQPENSGEEIKEEVEAAPLAEVVETNPEPTEVTEEEVMTQETVETIEMPVETEEEKEKRLEEEREKKKQEEFKKKLDNIWADKKASGGSEGETGKPGDQGKEHGDKNARSHTGGDSDGGASYDLSGRSMVSVPKIKDISQEEGRVVVSIIVERDGNVREATPGVLGSTTTNKHLWKIAKEAALKAKFSTHLYAPEEQRGTMTFVFVLE